ncbi:syntaxin-17 [Ambystoma mexicanum]|uniref:syntaxin-17 n=1 Tax=Ambystoma mexicanum TaxID=8296 RepID=UPI0037E72EF2
MYEKEEKLPLRRLEPSIHKLIKVAIPTDLERLRNHHINIKKYQRCQLWDKLHKEHVHAGRTVQQLQANISEMEKVCTRVRREDCQALEKLVSPVKKSTADATAEFLQLHLQSEALSKQQNLQEPTLYISSTTGHVCGAQDVEGMAQQQIPVQIFSPLPEIPEQQMAAESWQVLEDDLMDLSKLVTEFSEMVHSHQERIDTIEENINTATINVEEGTHNLGRAAKMQVVALPFAGALLGGLIGGPLGLISGLKVGGIVAALGGGVLGFTGGKLIQKKKTNIQQELSATSPSLLKKKMEK